MKTNSQKSNPNLWLGPFSFALLLLAICPQHVEAQSNTLPNSGNVGISTTSPQAQLHIGTINSNGIKTYTSSETNHGLLFSSYMDTNSPYRRYGDIVAMSNQDGISGGSTIRFLTNPNNSFTASERMRIDYLGNVGIGTASPQNSLDVNGSLLLRGNSAITNPSSVGPAINAGYFATGGYSFMQGFNYTTSAYIPLYVEGSKVIINPNSGGNVGIGTTSPDARLTVAATTLPTTYNPGDVATFVAAADSFTSLALVRGGVTNPQGLHFGVNNTSHYSEIQASQNGIATNNLILNRQGGNIGVGTTTPGEKLEVSGNLKVTGTGNIDASGTITAFNIKAKYQDVAEWVESSEALPAGTVVVLDQTKSNQVVASSQSYDTRVAGVVSAQPGIALGESGDNKVLVATTGRVRIKVDASRGPIYVGDLLVTSDTPGTAMKSEPVNIGGVQLHRPGTLIGKALEPLPKGTGEILVLLSLQ
jgi:hypothetical protein